MPGPRPLAPLPCQSQLRNESHAGHEGDEVSSPAAGPAGTGDRPTASCGPGAPANRQSAAPGTRGCGREGRCPRCIGLRRAS